MRALALPWMSLVALGACGGGAPPAPQPAVAAISIVAPRAGETDVEVAKVNGRPVWGSCIVGQIARGAKTRAAALDECVAFELLAQAAEQRGLATDPSVGEATRAALVNRLVQIDFEEKYQKPADLGDRMTKWLDDNAWRMHRPELRASSYARVEVAKDAPPETDARARKLAEAIAAELAGQTGLFGVNLRETAERLAKGTGAKLDIKDYKQSPRSGLESNYADGLFAVPEVGRVSAATRTKWGWDVILWSGGLPAKESSREEIAAEVFPELRRATFQVWVNQLIKQLQIHVEIDQAQVAKLEGAS